MRESPSGSPRKSKLQRRVEHEIKFLAADFLDKIPSAHQVYIGITVFKVDRWGNRQFSVFHNDCHTAYKRAIDNGQKRGYNQRKKPLPNVFAGQRAFLPDAPEGMEGGEDKAVD